jgi:hypothetical protein
MIPQQMTSLSAWRDRRYLVVDSNAACLPAVCIDTGQVATREPTALTVRLHTHAAAAVIFIVLVAVLGLATFVVAVKGDSWVASGTSGGIFVGAAVAAAVRVIHRLRPKRAWTIRGYVNDQTHTLSLKGKLVAFLLAPMTLMFALVVCLAAQVAVTTDHQVLMNVITCISLLFVILALATIGWGILRVGNGRPKPVRELICRHHDGDKLWIAGIHPNVLAQLPEYPPQGDSA